MSRDPFLYLEDILQAARWIEEYVADTDFDDFTVDHMRFNAVVRALEVIGEAARALPDAVKVGLPGVPWREIIGMRNVLAHAYFAVDPDVVWSAATEHVPPLAAAVERRLAQQTTPRDLAVELGITDKQIRAILRQWYEHTPYERWGLTPEMVDRVRRYFGSK